jgi:hypothetical protein
MEDMDGLLVSTADTWVEGVEDMEDTEHTGVLEQQVSTMEPMVVWVVAQHLERIAMLAESVVALVGGLGPCLMWVLEEEVMCRKTHSGMWDMEVISM